MPLIKFVALMIGIFLKTSGEFFFSGMVEKNIQVLRISGLQWIFQFHFIFFFKHNDSFKISFKVRHVALEFNKKKT